MARFQDFLPLAKARKTTYEFSGKKVSNADLKRILEAGRWAPSCGNIQPWKFIVVRNKKTRQGLIDNCAYYGDFHDYPALVIALALDLSCTHGKEKHSCLQVEGSSAANEARMCIPVAATAMVYEATSRGIDSCLLSASKTASRKILRVPKNFEVVLMAGFGYAKKNIFQKKRTRKKFTEIVDYDYFKRK
ncbi:MAG TPA: nitroreductase family protein [Candidatus Nanoarchaeia archaeon]|nr:nitroreductase family protein [Candidatus Nanoarchaeia archaeon]